MFKFLKNYIEIKIQKYRRKKLKKKNPIWYEENKKYISHIGKNILIMITQPEDFIDLTDYKAS